MTKRECAIKIIRECRTSHVLWARWQRKNVGWKRKVNSTDMGGPAFHERWVRKYDEVLKVLTLQGRRTRSASPKISVEARSTWRGEENEALGR